MMVFMVTTMVVTSAKAVVTKHKVISPAALVYQTSTWPK
jgi:hypothetical protein